MFSDIVLPRKAADNVMAGCIEIYDDIILHPDYFISVAEEMNRWRDANVHSESKNEDIVDKEYRSNLILDVNWDDYTTHPIFTYMNDLVKQYIDDYAERYEVCYEYIEATQLLKYSSGQYYKKHFDTGPNFPRVISALLYLNDIKQGGETYFPYFDVSIQPKAGRLVIFPSNYAYTHEARPPINGNKYVFVFWTREWERTY